MLTIERAGRSVKETRKHHSCEELKDNMAKSPELEGWVRTLATAEVEKICLCPGVARPIFQFRNITLAEG